MRTTKNYKQRQKLTEINQVLNGNPTVQNINDKVAEANQAKDQLNTARQGLTLDRQPALTTLHGASNLTKHNKIISRNKLMLLKIMLRLKQLSLTLRL